MPDVPDVDMVTPPPSSPGTDLITSLLSRLALLLNVELDIAAWSRLIGLIAIGSIILANMRNVLFSVNRVSSQSARAGHAPNATQPNLSRPAQIFKATSAGVSASFMLLFLAQLMVSPCSPSPRPIYLADPDAHSTQAVYLLTSLISLPSTLSESATTLLSTLPSFNVFSRLFDSVFLFAAGTVFFGRFVERKIRVVDGSGLT